MKALVVGGSSGIGLSIVEAMLSKGAEKIFVVSKDSPDINAIKDAVRADFEEKVVFKQHNLINFNPCFFDEFDDIDTLVITAGFGRVALFNELSDIEIKNLLRVNLEATTRIIKHFYKNISSKKNFYTAVMVSICGQIVSPFFSVYGASKGGLRFLIENLNCELEANGYKNRILDVSPGSLKGTSFNGGVNNLSQLGNLADEILDKMFKRETLYIPKFEETYKSVIQKYHENKSKFGLESYKYKSESGRQQSKSQVVVGYLSGTFDLFHIGHLNLLKRAKEQCDYLIVSVHESGAWKGKETFIPYNERVEIVNSIKYVDEIVEDFVDDSDAWDVYHYDKLFVGSDYKGTERFNRYESLLKGKAEIVYFPYTQETSSTQLREALKKASKNK